MHIYMSLLDIYLKEAKRINTNKHIVWDIKRM